jgi:hypothetical protein
MAFRDHDAIPTDDFNGLWARGDFDACPNDHFTDCLNIDFSQSNVFTRNLFAQFCAGVGNPIVRAYIFSTAISGTSKIYILALDTLGELWSIQISPTVIPPVRIWTTIVSGDFDIVNFNGRAYITFSNGRLGIGSQPLMVYDGYDWGGLAVFAGITPPSYAGPFFTAANSATIGNVSPGYHAFGVCFETSTGFLSPYIYYNIAGVPTALNCTGGFSVDFSNIPIFHGAAGDGVVVARRILASQQIILFSSTTNVKQVQLFFIPGGRIADNTTTAITLNFYDSQLTSDASYLGDSVAMDGIYAHVPSGVALGTYHNRLLTLAPNPSIGVTYTNAQPSNILVSNVNDPETVSIANGLIIVDPVRSSQILDVTGTPQIIGLTDAHEYRDTLYTWKLNKTYAITDNGGFPSTWPVIMLDEGVGAFVKGVVTILDSGGVNIDYLMVCDQTGVYTFNGLYIRPEITYKIADLWAKLNKTPDVNNPLRGINHFVNDTLAKKVYMSLDFTGANQPTQILLMNYSNTYIGDPNFYKGVRWALWGGNGGTVNSTAILIWDMGNKTKLLSMNMIDSNIYDYNGSGINKEVMATPYIQSGYLADPEDNFIHYGAIRLRALGNGIAPTIITPTFYNEDLTYNQTVANFTIQPTEGKELTILTNFQAQKALVRFSGQYFDINKFIVYVKELYISLPG